jgi:hypothetical protein
VGINGEQRGKNFIFEIFFERGKKIHLTFTSNECELLAPG